MLTSSPRKRNSLGSRTAWLRPLRKIFAVGMIDTSLYQGRTAPLKQYCHRQRRRPPYDSRLITRASLSALHLIALAIGFGAVFARGRRLRDLRRSPDDAAALTRLFQADALWGLAAVLWILTGVLRAFGGLEKTPAFYLGNGFFWVKMGLFVLILALEVRPMVTFVRWRAARARGRAPVAGSNWNALIAINDAETVVVVLITFVAALMARGAWLF